MDPDEPIPLPTGFDIKNIPLPLVHQDFTVSGEAMRESFERWFVRSPLPKMYTIEELLPPEFALEDIKDEAGRGIAADWWMEHDGEDKAHYLLSNPWAHIQIQMALKSRKLATQFLMEPFKPLSPSRHMILRGFE